MQKWVAISEKDDDLEKVYTWETVKVFGHLPHRDIKNKDV